MFGYLNFMESTTMTNIERLKKENIKLRKLLQENCSKQDFVPIWQGGYSGDMPDGGDVRYECNGCDIRCVKR